MNYNEKIISRLNLHNKFNTILKNKNIIYVTAPMGWGKTTAVIDYLRKNKFTYTYIDADNINVKQRIVTPYVVIDNLPFLPDVDNQTKIKQFLEDYNGKIFLISRILLPYYLKTLMMCEQIDIVTGEELRFTKNEIMMLMKVNAVVSSMPIADFIMNKTNGYPPYVKFLVLRLADGEKIDGNLDALARKDVYDFYYDQLFAKWDKKSREVLLYMAPFKKFTKEMAEKLSNVSDVSLLLNELTDTTQFLSLDTDNYYHFAQFFQEFSLYYQNKIWTSDKINENYNEAGKYYEMNGDIPNALECYYKCKNIMAISQLLIANSDKHPGVGHYYKTEKYYLILPSEIILTSPELMCSMSMLYSLTCNPEKSEFWFNNLQSYCKNCDKDSQEYKKSQIKLSYLRIALPHRGTKMLATIMMDTAKICISNSYKLQEFSVTGNLPSIMNGGKDFSRWSKHDRKLYHIMKKPVEFVLGLHGQGLAEIALAESLFEKKYDNNFTEILMLLNTGMFAAETKGVMEIYFSAVYILTKIFLREGKDDEAMNAVNDFIKKLDSSHYEQQLYPNIAAVITRLNLYNGNLDAMEEWLISNAPNENLGFYITNRFMYLTKVRVYIQKGEYDKSIALLTKLMRYFTEYGRIMCEIDAHVLFAITFYRMEDPRWREHFIKALNMVKSYNFIDCISSFGVAITELFAKSEYPVNTTFMERLIDCTHQQARLYPRYLAPLQDKVAALTDTEYSILVNISQGLKNDEISKVNYISINTVKFHIKNIYSKLGVANRTQAIKAAGELGII